MAGLGPQVVQVLDFATARAPELQALHELARHERMHTAVDDKLVTQRDQRRRRANAFKSHQMPRRLRLPIVASDPQEEELIRLGKGRGGHLERAPPPPLVVVDKAAKARAKKEQGPRCRKHRRRMHLLLDEHSWAKKATTPANDEDHEDQDQAEEEAELLETPKWLATHAWHAKRMRMSERYGHVLAQHRQDKSVSAALAALRSTATLHDASYYGLLELCGPAQLILEALQLVCDPSGSDFDEIKFLSGQEEGRSVLYHADQFPMGAIAPVTFMWRPVKEDFNGEAGAFVPPTTEDDGFPTTKRQLWLWIHPAAFMEAASAIAGACQEAIAEHDEHEAIEILDRRGRVARFQLRGKRANSMLDQVLKKCEVSVRTVADSAASVDDDDGFSDAVMNDMASTTNLKVLQRELRDVEKNLDARVHSVLVQDPRVKTNATGKQVAPSGGISLLEEPSVSLVDPSSDILCPLSGTSLLSGDAEEPDSALILTQLEAVLKWTTTSATTDDSTSVRPRTYPYAPVVPVKSDEQDVDMDQDDDSVARSPVPCSVLWSTSGRDSVRRSFRKDHEVNSPVADNRKRPSAGVPLLLVRKSSPFPDASGWDVLLSPVHASALLNALVFKGAMVIGLDEHEALATVVHEASFPRDFPDTVAGLEYWQRVADGLESEHVKKPKAKRVAYEKLGVDSPFQPDWNDLLGLNSTIDVIGSEDPADDDMIVDGNAEEEDNEETEAAESFCVLRGASYMEPFPFSSPAAEVADAAVQEVIPVPIPTLVRVALSFPRRGNVEPCSMIYIPTSDDMAKYLEDSKWNGRDWQQADTSEDELELMGYVTSAVYDRPKGAFRGTAFCACEPLQRLAIAYQHQQKQTQKLTSSGLLALTRTPTSRQLRPVLLHIQEA